MESTSISDVRRMCQRGAFRAYVQGGKVFGTRYQARAEISGGIILILMGSKILLEHFGFI